MFTGLSSLRKAEKKEPSAQNKALQAYLAQRYADGGGGSAGAGDVQQPKKKRKKKRDKPAGPAGVSIVDADDSGFDTAAAAGPATAAAGGAGRRPPDSDEQDDEEEAPVVANPEEAEALKLQIEKSKNFYSVGADGSGWMAAPAEQQRRQRHDSPAAAGDLSPPRRGRQRHDSPAAAGGDLSPPRRVRPRHDSPAAAGDLSPPRRGRQRHDSPAAAGGDLSPPRRGRQRHDSPAAAGGDLSPPRRGLQRHDSPAAAGGDLSPPRRGLQRHDSPADASPPRRPRSRSPAGAAAERPPAGARMGDGSAAGLVSSKQLAEEAARLRAEAEERKRRAAGRGEATVYRDKATGRVISADEYAEQLAKAKQKKAPPEEIHVAWKGGLAQQRAAQEAAQRAADEAGKAFARGFDDDADAHLRGRSRWGDPMAGKLRKDKGRDEFDLPPPLITDANREAMEASGFNVPQEVPQHSWLRRGVAAPSNRYNIRPGRHWDGVDRSNGFEKNMFKMLNQQRAQEAEARMWAQEDM